MAPTRPPVRGATIKSQSWEIALPPSKSAGPMLRAGFTDVPVMGIHMICTRTSVNPMTRPASLPAPFFLSVAPSATRTKINVNTVSAIKACNISPSPKPLLAAIVKPACEPVETNMKSTADPRIPPDDLGNHV